MLREVPGIQRTMFNHRIIAALSFMTGFFSASGFYQYGVGNSSEIIIPLILLPLSIGLYYSYRRLAPSPELSILRVWNEIKH